jgi:hypothetical protein
MARDEAIDVGGLADLDVAALRQRWLEQFGAEPPGRISQELLAQAIAYRLQEKAFGGLKKAARRELARFAEEYRATGSISLCSNPGLKPGTKLIRVWQGRNHEVEVLTDGFNWSGRRYGSLSEIARAITGTRWSGPRFFGLEVAKRAAPLSVSGCPDG